MHAADIRDVVKRQVYISLSEQLFWLTIILIRSKSVIHKPKRKNEAVTAKKQKKKKFSPYLRIGYKKQAHKVHTYDR